MGCDIHMIRQRQTGTGAWEMCDPMVPNPYYGKWEGAPKEVPERLYDWRNYELFAALAGVRNGWGIVPVSPPKGLPEGIDTDNGPDLGDHSYSWLTTDELLAYDWNQPIEQHGVVAWSERARWVDARTNGPGAYCGGVSGYGVEIVAPEELDRRIAANDTHDRLYGRFAWTESLREAIGEKWFEALDSLKEMPGKVRIVFGFDS